MVDSVTRGVRGLSSTQGQVGQTASQGSTTPSKFVHGALVELMQTFLLPVPNVIIFQYNPETMMHSWSQPKPAPHRGKAPSNPLAVQGTPGESFSFTIALDANDMIADGSPVAQDIALVSGVYSRIAALEMLMYPVAQGKPGLLGSVSASASLTGGVSVFPGKAKCKIPQMQVPTVLFVWGLGRIVPVRVTKLDITEQLYDEYLNPTHAEAAIELQVLTPEELQFDKDILANVARGAYLYSHGLRQALATVNLANATESIIGMLPT